MTCIVAENRPLSKLRRRLELPFKCHSLRDDSCVHKLDRQVGNYTMGIPGAALGYCQALFVKKTDPQSHTQNIINLLSDINAPWHKSHELYWGNRGKESVSDFITQSVAPLLGTGRMPILISPLNPNADYKIIKEILNTDPLVFEGETTLVRVVLTNNESVDRIASLMKEVLESAKQKNKMPKFWPLLQGQLKQEEWQHLKNIMGNDWEFLNIAVNPFMIDSLPDICSAQVTVAQVVLGHAEGINVNGTIQLPKGMTIAGANESDEYNIFQYFTKLEKFKISPTLIILGPSLTSWSDEYNLFRIEKLMPLLRESCNQLWRGLSDSRKEMVWSLSA